MEAKEGVLTLLKKKSAIGDIGFTHVHCAQTKNILAILPSHQWCFRIGASLKKDLIFLKLGKILEIEVAPSIQV